MGDDGGGSGLGLGSGLSMNSGGLGLSFGGGLGLSSNSEGASSIGSGIGDSLGGFSHSSSIGSSNLSLSNPNTYSGLNNPGPSAAEAAAAQQKAFYTDSAFAKFAPFIANIMLGPVAGLALKGGLAFAASNVGNGLATDSSSTSPSITPAQSPFAGINFSGASIPYTSSGSSALSQTLGSSMAATTTANPIDTLGTSLLGGFFSKYLGGNTSASTTQAALMAADPFAAQRAQYQGPLANLVNSSGGQAPGTQPGLGQLQSQANTLSNISNSYARDFGDATDLTSGLARQPSASSIANQYSATNNLANSAATSIASAFQYNAPQNMAAYQAPNTSPADFKFSQDDPSYQFRLQQGQQALERSAFSKGMGLSGNLGQALVDYGQGAASQEYQSAFNRYATTRQMQDTERGISLSERAQAANEFNANRTFGLAANESNRNALMTAATADRSFALDAMNADRSAQLNANNMDRTYALNTAQQQMSALSADRAYDTSNRTLDLQTQQAQVNRDLQQYNMTAGAFDRSQQAYQSQVSLLGQLSGATSGSQGTAANILGNLGISQQQAATALGSQMSNALLGQGGLLGAGVSALGNSNLLSGLGSVAGSIGSGLGQAWDWLSGANKATQAVDTAQNVDDASSIYNLFNSDSSLLNWF